MRVHVCLHAPFEGLAGIEPWLIARGATIRFTRFFDGEAAPAPEELDWLILMGGPMSVNDEAELPWLISERRLVSEAVKQDKTVLGICLGAQMIAKALGGTVIKNREREIGWFPVTRIAGAEQHPLGNCFPPHLEVFHWHGETFSLPADSMHLLRSEACENQAFAVGPKVLGLQFHCEMTSQALREMLEGDADGIGTGRYVQGPEQMRAEAERAVPMTRVLHAVLSVLAAETAKTLSRGRAQ
jgi:GMP synthase-like glutamine amidotransferase